MTAEHCRDTILDDRDRGDAVILSWVPTGQSPRRVAFVPRAATGPDWERIVQERRDGDWRTTGRDLVNRVAVEDGRDA